MLYCSDKPAVVNGKLLGIRMCTFALYQCADYVCASYAGASEACVACVTFAVGLA